MAPTCTTDGYTVYTCACGATRRGDPTPRLGHNFVNGVCTNCGLTEAEAPCDGGAACPSRPYSDVNTNRWYHAGVDFVIANGLMNGVGSGRFDPDGSMTRAMLVTVLWRYAGQPAASGAPFSDVPAGKWYTRAVAWASEQGVVNGVGGGRFDPDGQITREQMAAILYRYAAGTGVDVSAQASLTGFPDGANASRYAVKPLQWCLAEGIIGGTSSGGVIYLAPQGSATRAQVATILMRYLSSK